MRSLILASFLLAGILHAEPSFILTSTLSPLPGVVSGGSGSGEVDVSPDESSVFVSLFVSNLNGEVAPGTGIYGPGQFGSLVIGLQVPFPSFNSGILTGTFELPDGALAELLAGQLYFTVLTDQVGMESDVLSKVTADDFETITREVGGQIALSSVPEPSTVGTLAIALAAVGFGSWRKSRTNA